MGAVQQALHFNLWQSSPIQRVYHLPPQEQRLGRAAGLTVGIRYCPSPEWAGSGGGRRRRRPGNRLARLRAAAAGPVAECSTNGWHSLPPLARVAAGRRAAMSAPRALARPSPCLAAPAEAHWEMARAMGCGMRGRCRNMEQPRCLLGKARRLRGRPRAAPLLLGLVERASDDLISLLNQDEPA